MGWPLTSGGPGGTGEASGWGQDAGRPNSALTTVATDIAGGVSPVRRGLGPVIGFGGRAVTSPSADYGRSLSQMGLCPSATSREATGMAERAAARFGAPGGSWRSSKEGFLGRSSSSPMISSSVAGSGAGTSSPTGGSFGLPSPSSRGRPNTSASRRKGLMAARGWLPCPMESAEVSELAESARALFAAYDTSCDGRIDLSEFVEAQALLSDAFGVKSDKRAATQLFYDIENARLRGSVAFAEFFRAEILRLEAEEDAILMTSPSRSEWPKRMMWCARQISLGRQRQRLRALAEETAKLVSEARLAGSSNAEAAARKTRLSELQRQRQKELEDRLVIRGVTCYGAAKPVEGALIELTPVAADYSTAQGACVSKARSNPLGIYEHRVDVVSGQALSLIASAEGHCPAYRVVGGEGLRQVALELAPFTLKGRLRAEAGREGIETIRDLGSGASFDIPVGELQKDGRPFDGEAVLGVSIVDMASKEALQTVPSLLGRCASGDVLPLQFVSAVFMELRDLFDGRLLQLRPGSAGLEVTLPTKALMPVRQPSLWHYDVPRGMWEEVQNPLALDGVELPLQLLEPESDRSEEEVGKRLASSSDALKMPAQTAAVEAVSAVFGEPGKRLKASRFYGTREAQRGLPALRTLADGLLEAAQVVDANTGNRIEDVDPRALELVVLEQLLGLWAVPAATPIASLVEMREVLTHCANNIEEAFLAIAASQARRDEAARVRQMLRAKDPYKVARYSVIEIALDKQAGQERDAADTLASDFSIYRQAELERVREAVRNLLPGACPSTRELSAAQGTARAKARQAAEAAAEASTAAAKAEEELESKKGELEAAKASKDKDVKAQVPTLTQEVADAEELYNQAKTSAETADEAATEAASPARAAELLAEDPEQQERAKERLEIRSNSTQGLSRSWSSQKMAKHTFSFQVSETGWDCIAAPQALPPQAKMPKRSPDQVCSLVLGSLENAAFIVSVKAVGVRHKIADRSEDMLPEGYFSLLVLAGSQFEIRALHDDLETTTVYGPFTAEGPGNVLHLGVLSEAASPSRVNIFMPALSRMQGSRASSKH
mmetsp:Transcript_60927/g.108214  ORF Transcript_60927/g.108214 Transcript_60927/m.108214 type:complete len:1070 (+) Transcript_60927:41-3250(+)